MKKIDIFIKEKEDLSEKYNASVLSNEINSYIESKCLIVNKKDKISISIHTDNDLQEEDKEYAERLIKNNYKELYREKLIIKKYQNKRGLLLVIIGILFVALSNLLPNEGIISELFLIVGWVALWEVIYKILFDDIKDKIEIERYKKLSICKINYITKKPLQ